MRVSYPLTCWLVAPSARIFQFCFLVSEKKCSTFNSTACSSVSKAINHAGVSVSPSCPGRFKIVLSYDNNCLRQMLDVYWYNWSRFENATDSTRKYLRTDQT